MMEWASARLGSRSSALWALWIGVSATLWAGAILFTLVQAAPLLSRDVRTLRRTDEAVSVDPSPEREAATAS